jgi:hypothetical protein
MATSTSRGWIASTGRGMTTRASTKHKDERRSRKKESRGKARAMVGASDGEEIFQEEEHEHGDDEDCSVVPPAEHVPTTSTTVVDGPSPTPTTTNQDRGEAIVEGEVASRREPPRRGQVDHPASGSSAT